MCMYVLCLGGVCPKSGIIMTSSIVLIDQDLPIDCDIKVTYKALLVTSVKKL